MQARDWLEHEINQSRHKLYRVLLSYPARAHPDPARLPLAALARRDHTRVDPRVSRGCRGTREVAGAVLCALIAGEVRGAGALGALRAVGSKYTYKYHKTGTSTSTSTSTSTVLYSAVVRETVCWVSVSLVELAPGNHAGFCSPMAISRCSSLTCAMSALH